MLMLGTILTMQANISKAVLLTDRLDIAIVPKSLIKGFNRGS